MHFSSQVCVPWRWSNQHDSTWWKSIKMKDQIGSFLHFFLWYQNLPSSPHTSTLAMQGISTYPNSFNLETCSAVMGCCHMAVFIAGQKRRGRLISQALTTLVCQHTNQHGKHFRGHHIIHFHVSEKTVDNQLKKTSCLPADCHKYH